MNDSLEKPMIWKILQALERPLRVSAINMVVVPLREIFLDACRESCATAQGRQLDGPKEVLPHHRAAIAPNS